MIRPYRIAALLLCGILLLTASCAKPIEQPEAETTAVPTVAPTETTAATAEPTEATAVTSSVPEPSEMVGQWELVWTEVEGDRNEAAPNSQVLEIMVGTDGLYRISLTDNEFPDWSFYEQELVVFPFELYYGCENSQWEAAVNYTDAFGTGYDLTLLDSDTLLLQSNWEMDGAPMVGYSCFQRVDD